MTDPYVVVSSLTPPTSVILLGQPSLWPQELSPATSNKQSPAATAHLENTRMVGIVFCYFEVNIQRSE